ncbi:MAG TPA: gamma-glutamylcyclotransferase [Sandaracinaceae bacterium LLY-WYZ-13_1]|nr:gamma-glutamylcyclotransferase [Sandaracinaceae bacterium LLY-WYZ-13_1]
MRWIFGYGSLVWRPAFEHLERRPARLRGWARRFWQGSTDHRGVPGAPGRVVTLVEAPEATTAGMAYRVSDDVFEAVIAKLDHREKGGYERRVVALEAHGGARLSALVYLAGPSNPHYLGPAAADRIVAQIDRARGPSGPNDEYLLRLERWLRDVGERDAHVFELAAALRRRRAAPRDPRASDRPPPG